MEVHIKELHGNWRLGYAMDKHIIKSVFIGYSESGRAQFDTERTEVGEALFQLKYRDDWNQVQPLAQCLQQHAFPLFENVGFIVPMPASIERDRQPVTEIAQVLAGLVNKPCFDSILKKAPGGPYLKNLHTKAEKVAVIGNAFSITPAITNEGHWNVLVIDDLYHTGATTEAACAALRGYNKINNIYVAALTWKPS